MLPESHPLYEAELMLSIWFEKAPTDSWIEFRSLLHKDDPRKGKEPDVLIEACTVGTFEQSFDAVIAPWIMDANSPARRRDIYWGVCPRVTMRRANGKRVCAGRSADVADAVGAWVDVDYPHWARMVEEEKPPATFIYGTGNGCQMLFRFQNLRPVQEAIEISKKLAVKYGGDSVADPPRILRLPGTKNWKEWPKWINEHPNGKPAQLVLLAPDTVYVPDLSPAASESPQVKDVMALHWDLRNVILTGYKNAVSLFPQAKDPLTGEIDRSQVDYNVAVRLFLEGWGDEQVAEVFRNPNYGISEKYHEEVKRGNGENYLQVTLRKAAQKASVEKARWGMIGQELTLETPKEIAAAPKLTFAVDSVLPVGGMLIVSGPAKAGKSLVVTDLALIIAGVKGKLFDRFACHAPGTVVYCQAEISRSSLKMRLDAIGASRNAKWEDYPLRFHCGPLNLLDTSHTDALKRALERTKANYLILDPLARYHRGNENSQEVMSAVLSSFERVGRDTGLTGMILVHHHGKQGENPKEGAHRARGSSVIADWGNAHVVMKKRFSDSTGRKFITVEFELRDAEEPNPINLALEPETLRFRDWSPEEERLAVTMGILDRFSGLPRKDLVGEVAQELGTTKTEAERLISKVRVLNTIAQKQDEKSSKPRVEEDVEESEKEVNDDGEAPV